MNLKLESDWKLLKSNSEQSYSACTKMFQVLMKFFFFFFFDSENQANLGLWTQAMHSTTVGAVLHLEVNRTTPYLQ